MCDKYLLNEVEWECLRWLSTDKYLPFYLSNELGRFRDVMTQELHLKCSECQVIIEKLRENGLINFEPRIFSTGMTFSGLYSKRTTEKGDKALSEHYNQESNND